MSWQVTLHPHAPIVETVYAGLMSAADLKAAEQATLTVAQKHGRRLLLTNCTTLTGAPSVVELYFRAAELANGGQIYTLKEAILSPQMPAVSELVSFWQTTASNRGLQVQLFDQRDCAIAWLLQVCTV